MANAPWARQACWRRPVTTTWSCSTADRRIGSRLPAAVWRRAGEHHRTSTATWVAGQPRPVLSAGSGQRPRGRHGRPGTDRAAAAGRAALPPHRVHLPADLRAGVRYHQGRRQLRRWHLVGSLRAQTRPNRGLADRIPVPLMLIWAPSWGWVVAANVLLGINQGL